MVDERAWVWFGGDYGVQHLAVPPDAIEMEWDDTTACGLEGTVRRVTFENVDNAKACAACTQEPFKLAGDARGLP